MCDCPNCDNHQARIFWEAVKWCGKCGTASLVRDDRYALVCPTDGTRLVPRSKYQTPTLVCLKCQQEFEPPGEADPQILEAELD